MYHTTHGMTKTRTYTTWSDMKKRCKPHKGGYLHPHNKCYKGKTYCPSWERFENFLADMGIKPDGLYLDRIDNNKGYYKENCRWVTASQSSSNKNAHHSDTLRGTQKIGNKYMARIKINKKRHCLGSYKTALEAHIVYVEAYKKRWGELPPARNEGINKGEGE